MATELVSSRMAKWAIAEPGLDETIKQRGTP